MGSSIDNRYRKKKTAPKNVRQKEETEKEKTVMEEDIDRLQNTQTNKQSNQLSSNGNFGRN
jgi:hypothetical protein